MKTAEQKVLAILNSNHDENTVIEAWRKSQSMKKVANAIFTLTFLVMGVSMVSSIVIASFHGHMDEMMFNEILGADFIVASVSVSIILVMNLFGIPDVFDHSMDFAPYSTLTSEAKDRASWLFDETNDTAPLVQKYKQFVSHRDLVWKEIKMLFEVQFQYINQKG